MLLHRLVSEKPVDLVGRCLGRVTYPVQEDGPRLSNIEMRWAGRPVRSAPLHTAARYVA